jgi:hypothetical protein
LQGGIDSLSIPLDSSVKEIVRDGEKLFMEVPGQQARELTPIRGLLFSLQGLTGYSVEFKMAAPLGPATVPETEKV